MPASIYSDNVRHQKTPPRIEEDKPSPLSNKNTSFLESIKTAYPKFSFLPGRKFLFRPPKTIYYLESNENFRFLLLHELSHAVLGHFTFEKSLERLQLERDAWEKTRELCKTYDVPFDESLAEEELDTYRDWVHKKTLCKTCGLTCLEVSPESLYCPFCQKFYKKS
ncbi:hypothetical protein IKG20_03035 [Candidatus Saccharibacteria bacterium]|nr:hypothetical protein [Candidatus Saccharibacteria bacterium]